MSYEIEETAEGIRITLKTKVTRTMTLKRMMEFLILKARGKKIKPLS